MKEVIFWKPVKSKFNIKPIFQPTPFKPIKPLPLPPKQNPVPYPAKPLPMKFHSKPFSPVNLKAYPPKRTKQEWKLIDRNPYGDKDKDKLMNFFDCKPANFGLQGMFDKKPKKVGRPIASGRGAESRRRIKYPKGTTRRERTIILEKPSNKQKVDLPTDLKKVSKTESLVKATQKPVPFRGIAKERVGQLQNLAAVIKDVKVINIPNAEKVNYKNLEDLNKLRATHPISEFKLTKKEEKNIKDFVKKFKGDLREEKMDKNKDINEQIKKQEEGVIQGREGFFKKFLEDKKGIMAPPPFDDDKEKKEEERRMKEAVEKRLREANAKEFADKNLNKAYKDVNKTVELMGEFMKGNASKADVYKNLDKSIMKLGKELFPNMKEPTGEKYAEAAKKFIKDVEAFKSLKNDGDKNKTEVPPKYYVSEKQPTKLIIKPGKIKPIKEPSVNEMMQKQWEEDVKDMKKMAESLGAPKFVRLVKGDTPEEWNKREKIKEESEEMEMATLGDEFGRKKGKELKEYDTQDFIDAPMKEIKQKKEREEKIDKEMEKDYGPKDKEEIEKKEKRERLERETEPSLRDISKEYGIDYIEGGDD